MKPALPFLETDTAPRVTIQFDGAPLAVPQGSNLAAVLLAAGIRTFRYSPVSGAPRAPHCMMGACFECLVDIDGVTRQACMVGVSEGLVVNRLATAEEPDADL
ncbi:(2Fe-2S)-binding protein [uncultured Marivita sp.]|uniref:(2Fe-2S)-binding protein n=1 Tax=Marivita sp. TaxID=2003365 RepID=UPI0025F3D5DE|nr:(2Fe-2S)-binding protein [uncultured Marivita sp.]MCR9111468.1 (2Fe-2S)-binding protein [Paracoccaceae bacterium]